MSQKISSACNDGREHCWHKAKVQHDIRVDSGIHLDEFCCWCPEIRCRSVVFSGRRRGHGPNSLGTKTMPVVPIVQGSMRVYKKNTVGNGNPLTLKQQSYLVDIASGMTTKQSQEHHEVSDYVIRHRGRLIRKKLGAKTVAQAVYIAAKKNYI